jgi:hypothetical protein
MKQCILWGLTIAMMLVNAGNVSAQTPPAPSKPKPKPTFPPHTVVLKDYSKIVSTTGSSKSLYTIYKHKTEQKLLAELPSNFASQKYFIAMTVASGEEFAGLQAGDMYVYWRRYGKRLALMEPNVKVRSTGEPESKASVKRLFTDRVLTDTTIMTLGPSGGPVIDITSLLVGRSSLFFGSSGITNPNLITIKKAKAFPKNVELAFEGPGRGGRLKTLHYSISAITSSPGYKPRLADQRIGYFTTAYTDLGKYKDTETRVRFINRWHLVKRDPRLKLSPPVKPIKFILEHTVPVRYRRWVMNGVTQWNKAFERIGFLNAIEVDFQDAQTGRNMDLDPEDVRYNFVRWLNNNIGTAIGPSRVNPMTGEILDADIVLTDGWIRHFWHQFDDILPSVAMEGFNAETLAWLARNPRWDPRVRLAHPARRAQVIREIVRAAAGPLSGHPAAQKRSHLVGSKQYDGLIGRVSQINGLCMASQGKSMDLALMHLELALLDAEEKEKKKKKKEKADEEAKKKAGDKKDGDKKDGDKKDGDKKEEKKEEPKKPKEFLLDGLPESFIGPLLAELVAHEVGHTLGLRHNFKGSSIYDLATINSDKIKDKKPLAGSVMDYLPINMTKGGKEGNWSMLSIGPYDEWAIEYGYTLAKDLKPILARVNEPELVFGTDEDTGGPDPYSRRYDFGKDPLAFAKKQMALVAKHRANLLKTFVKDGDSWARARFGYSLSLSLQMRATSMMGNWLGGAFVSRAKKGDKGSGNPITVVPVKQQREALQFVIDNSLRDAAFGLSTELLNHLAVDKWMDSRSFFEEETWQVHDRIMGIQASALTMVMNPTTLRRIYDNELRVPADQDAMTLPEVLTSLTKAIWSEFDKVPTKPHTSRVPLVSSLRRNLQQEHLSRLIDLSHPDSGSTEAYKPIANQASFEMNNILARINKVLKARKNADPYTLAHLEKLKEQIEKSKAAQSIYNTSEIGGGGGFRSPFFFREVEKKDVE